jgi:hypothetical protein
MWYEIIRHLDTLVLPTTSRTTKVYEPTEMTYRGMNMILNTTYAKSIFGYLPTGEPWEVL